MNGYEKSVALNLTGSDAEKVAILQTLTVSNIAVDAVRVWLRENLLWFRTSPTTMGGSIQAVLESAETPTETKQQLGLFWSAVFGDGAQNLLTTVPTWAGLVWQIIQGLTQAAPDAATLVDSFYALDGGRPYKDLTVEDFVSQKAEAESNQDPSVFDVLMSINRTSGVLRISMNVSRDGEQTRLASMVEGQGSQADQTLLAAIETAIDTWLVGG